METSNGSGAVEPVEIEGVRFWFRRGPNALSRTLGHAVLEATRDESRAIKRGRRKMLFGLDHGGRSFLLKVNHYSGGVPDWFRRSKARREWQRAQAIVKRGIETPLFVAMAEQRRRDGRLLRCVSVVERIAGASDLNERWRRARPSWPEQKRWARELGALARRMHTAGVLQRDFAPNNILVVPDPPAPRFVPIDFERAALVARVGDQDAAACLTKLHRYFYDSPSSLWWRFLLGYSDGDTAVAAALARRVSGEVPRLLRRDLAHLRRTAGRQNRRFRALPDAGGWAHRAIANDDLFTLLRGESSERYWQSPIHAWGAREALEHWSCAQALSQRSGLIAKPLALIAPRESTGETWTLVSERRPGEAPWQTASETRSGSLRVLGRRTVALGMAPPTPEQVLSCSEAPGARLRTPPG